MTWGERVQSISSCYLRRESRLPSRMAVLTCPRGFRKAEPFLPAPMDKNGRPSITCHLGPHDQQVPTDFKMFDSRRVGELHLLRVPHHR